jgi:uncharacterized protein YacL
LSANLLNICLKFGDGLVYEELVLLFYFLLIFNNMLFLQMIFMYQKKITSLRCGTTCYTQQHLEVCFLIVVLFLFFFIHNIEFIYLDEDCNLFLNDVLNGFEDEYSITNTEEFVDSEIEDKMFRMKKNEVSYQIDPEDFQKIFDTVLIIFGAVGFL